MVQKDGNNGSSQNMQEPADLRYCKRASLLPDSALETYRVLEELAGHRLTVFLKVDLAEIFYVGEQENDRISAKRISLKPVDMLLCRSDTLEPILAIELEDPDSGEDARAIQSRLMERIFNDAGLPLVRIPLRGSYPRSQLVRLFQKALGVKLRPKEARAAGTGAQKKQMYGAPPRCQKCNQEMVIKKARYGRYNGQAFFVCPNYPDCREVVRVP